MGRKKKIEPVKVKNVKEVVAALRCVHSTTDNWNGDCKKCNYYEKATDEEKDEFCFRHNVTRAMFSDDFWDSCDTDRIGIDAADLLEDLAEIIARIPREALHEAAKGVE